jgi:acid phosphatase (class A)
MTMKSRFFAMNRGRTNGGPILSLLLWFCLAARILGQPLYLAPGHPDGVALLPPPPASGSAEEAADLASARAVFQGRTSGEEKRAFKDSSLAFSLFASAIGPEFNPDKMPRTWAVLQEVKKEIGAAIDTPKDFWKRPRPYVLDERLSLGKPEPSFSYPSGHSTRGTVYALVLAEIFPSDHQAIYEIGRNIGWDRVLIGKHFPSDVYAGRVLGQAIVRELKANTRFQADLAAARAEAAAAQESRGGKGRWAKGSSGRGPGTLTKT